MKSNLYNGIMKKGFCSRSKAQLSKNVLYLILAAAVTGSVLTSCSNSESKEGTQSYGDSTKRSGPDNNPAPDNNSANNPSLADTAYKSGDTSHKTDTMNRK